MAKNTFDTFPGGRDAPPPERDKCWRMRWIEGTVTVSPAIYPPPWGRRGAPCYDVTIDGYFHETCECCEQNPRKQCQVECACELPSPGAAKCVDGEFDVDDGGQGAYCEAYPPEDTGILCMEYVVESDLPPYGNCKCSPPVDERFSITMPCLRPAGFDSLENSQVASMIGGAMVNTSDPDQTSMSAEDAATIERFKQSNKCDCAYESYG